MTELDLSFTELLFWPLTLPIRGFAFLLEHIRETADRELYDPQVVQQRLLELQLLYELGEVPEPEYRARWNDLARRLTMLGTERNLPE